MRSRAASRSKTAGSAVDPAAAGPATDGHGQALQDLEELLGPERLGDVAVHARRQAAFPVALQGVGGHGDDRGMGAGARLAGPDRGGRLEPVHLRHLHVHQHGIERRAVVQGVERLAAVADDHDLMAPFLQQADRQPLVDRVVLGQQEPQLPPARCPPRRRPASRRSRSSTLADAPRVVMIASRRVDCRIGFVR